MHLFTRKRIVKLIILLVLVFFYQYLPIRVQPVPSTFDSNSSSATTSTKDIFTVIRVVDGDTLIIDTGQKVRLIGINTPETVDPRQVVQCFGKEASDFMKKLLEGKKIRLKKDVSETDTYERLLRFVYLIREDESELFVNEELLVQGYARVSTFPPDVLYAQQFILTEKSARDEKRGLWSACPQS